MTSRHVLGCTPCECDSLLWKMAAGQKEKGTGSYALLAKHTHTHKKKEINISLGKPTDSSDHLHVIMGH